MMNSGASWEYIFASSFTIQFTNYSFSQMVWCVCLLEKNSNKGWET